MYTTKTKIRLSIEKVSGVTKYCLKQKHKEAAKNLFLRSILEDLLNRIHVVKDVPPNNICELIRNNYIEALAAEFPDLVVEQKHRPL